MQSDINSKQVNYSQFSPSDKKLLVVLFLTFFLFVFLIVFAGLLGNRYIKSKGISFSEFMSNNIGLFTDNASYLDDNSSNYTHPSNELNKHSSNSVDDLTDIENENQSDVHADVKVDVKADVKVGENQADINRSTSGEENAYCYNLYLPQSVEIAELEKYKNKCLTYKQYVDVSKSVNDLISSRNLVLVEERRVDMYCDQDSDFYKDRCDSAKENYSLKKIDFSKKLKDLEDYLSRL